MFVEKNRVYRMTLNNSPAIILLEKHFNFLTKKSYNKDFSTTKIKST